ncbi:MAG: adenine deaminase [Planctomycetes bacterium]|nr:adenine deaminase [Planctomycetota bacterium]
MDLKTCVEVAVGKRPADLVLKNGRIVNVLSCEIHEGDIAIVGDRIVGIGAYEGVDTVDLDGRHVCPGFIDGHVHIESSMLSVPEFAKLVVTHGTTAVIADPHEIANVIGAEGIRFMLSSSKYCPIFVYIMVSSCVPASDFESAGAELSALDIEPLLSDKWVLGLAEVMNYPAVIACDSEYLDKLALSDGRPIDGHAPGLSGRELCAYITSGIGSDHECTSLEEAREKLRLGLTVMIREGSQARNLDALLPLVQPDTLDRFMFVTDDKDVDDLRAEGHIDFMIRRAIAGGLAPVHAIRLATYNPARYFGLDHLGVIAPGKLASLVVLDSLEECRVARVYHAGRLVADSGLVIDRDAAKRRPQILRSSINVHWLEPEQFAIAAPHAGECRVHVIEMIEDRIDTGRSIESLKVVGGQLHADLQRDLCKVAVIERHQASGNLGLGFVRGLGLSAGAIASSVGHDSHNLVVVGTNDHDMYTAAVHVVKLRGGFCAVRDGKVLGEVALPIGGLMSTVDAETLSAQLRALHEAAQALDVKLRRPFMAMSFLSLSVIGALKITDQGLVDVGQFKLIDLVVNDE